MTTKWQPGRDPSIEHLINSAREDWGDPEKQRLGLVPYGINILDQITYGIDFHNGGLLLFQGEEKQRKTTVVANIVKNLLMSPRWPGDWRIAVDLAESGLPPAKYRDILVAMMATDILARWHWLGNSIEPVHLLFAQELPNKPVGELLDIPHVGIDYKFLRYNRRTETQERAIKLALETMRAWPLDVFGPAKIDGETRNAAIARLRWEWCLKRNTRLIVYDHCQQMDTNGGGDRDYEKLEAITPLIAGVVVDHPGLVFCAISQVSMTSVRDARNGWGKPTSRGGKKLQEEANNVFAISYDGESRCGIDLSESRDSPPVRVVQPLDATSGCFIGKARSAR